MLPELKVSEYTYNLPDHKIAKEPLTRGTSKLLSYQKGEISHHSFPEIINLLPKDHALVFNNTKVLPARMFFQKDTGAKIELFLLKPINPSKEIEMAMQATSPVVWKCAIGNLKKWKEGQVLTPKTSLNTKVTANLIDRENMLVEFHWESDISFVELVEELGKTPLPPYLNREVSEEDKDNYQTVYSKKEGAVAAPTAGLHFTEDIINTLKGNAYPIEEVTLHVSAGTFQPMKSENVTDHPMHSEQIVITKSNLTFFLNNKKLIATGTTSMRTLESIYWIGVNCIQKKEHIFQVQKLDPYQSTDSLPTRDQALSAILHYMEENDLETISGATEIFIFPGYNFKMVQGLITNFHQPGSTLILLISAFIGKDWKQVYQTALDNEYRFLSYGDSNFYLPK